MEAAERHARKYIGAIPAENGKEGKEEAEKEEGVEGVGGGEEGEEGGEGRCRTAIVMFHRTANAYVHARVQYSVITRRHPGECARVCLLKQVTRACVQVHRALCHRQPPSRAEA